MQDTITIRPTVPKTELVRLSGGNISRWVNSLIENAASKQAQGWDGFMDKPRRRVASASDEVRKASR